MKKYGKLLYLGIIVLFLYLPIFTLMVLSFNKGKSMSAWQGTSLKWYIEMFRNEEIINALGNTLTIALWASILATIVGLLACIGMNAMRDKSRSFFMGINNIPLLNADIVTGISIMMSFMLFGISLNYASVLFAHITFCIPYVILSIMPKFKQLENQTYEAALDLGATPLYAFFHIVLPDLMPGIMAGFLLSFTMSVDDFVITHFTRGAGINTLSTLIYSQLKIGVRPTLYALSTVIFVLVLVFLIFINIASGKGESKISAKSASKEDYDYKGSSPFKKFAMIFGILVVIVFAIKFTPTVPGKVTEKGVVYVYNFGDYIDPEVVADFEEETGYSVVTDYFDTNEEMYPVIKNSSARYDVVCASDYMIDKMIKENLLAKIDFRYIPNIVNLQENIRHFTESFDKDMSYAVPHTWGTYGILYNTKMIKEVPIGWSDLWAEKNKGTIIMPNSIREAYMIGAKMLGYSINTVNEGELKEITELLRKQKPLVYAYGNDNARDLMIGNSAALGVVTSGEVLYAMDENPDLNFIVPKEGTEVWTDMWAITSRAKNKEGAEAWINYMLSEKAARKNFEYLTYGIPNKKIKDLTDNPILNPSDAVLSRCETLKSLGSKGDDLYSKYWKDFKS